MSSLIMIGKEITDKDNIFDEIKNPENYTLIDLSNNKLTSLPPDLSKFINLTHLNLTKNNFINYEEVANSLSTIPQLKELQIDLSNQENAIAILSVLTNLNKLNGQNTNDTISNSLNSTLRKSSYNKNNDITGDYSKMEFNNDISLNDEIESFTEIIQFFNDNDFNLKFQQKLKDEVSIINSNIQKPKQIFNIYTIKSKINIYHFLTNEILNNILKYNNENVDSLNNILHLIKKKIIENENLLFNNLLNFSNLELSKSKDENKLNIEEDSNKEIFEEKKEENYNDNNKINIQGNNKTQSKFYADNDNINITKQQLINFLKNIFKFHKDINKKNQQNHLPKETLTTSVSTYLQTKYGLKNISQYWEKQIFMGLNYFTDEETEIKLFTNIIENKIEESTSDLIEELRKSCDNILLELIKQKNPFKVSREIDLLFKKKKNAFLTHKDWKKILDSLFPEDNEISYNKIVEFIKNANNQDQKYIEFNIEKGYEYLMTREDKRNFLSNANNSTVKLNIIYTDFVHLISDIQIELRKDYLEKISNIFIKYDDDSDGLINEEQFNELMKELGIPQFTDKFLDKIDPYENSCICFSDIINVFMEEHLPYDNMSLLDKILSF